MDHAMESLMQRLETASNRLDQGMFEYTEKSGLTTDENVRDAVKFPKNAAKTYMWGGFFRRLPQNYELPRATL